MRAGLARPVSRRRLLTSLGLGAGALLLADSAKAGHSPLGEQRLAGRVFDEARGDGVQGVMVSNGRDVVVSGAGGRWSLPARDGDVIFVIKPAHWRLSSATHGRFWHLHQPRGTPAELALRGPTVKPTGAPPASVDFSLVREAEPDLFEVLLFADTQPANAVELGYVRQMVARSLARVRPAFAINHGDILGDDLALFPDYLEIVAETGCAWHHCPGNHDMNLDAPFRRFAFEAWKQFAGPTHYAFQHASATFILLNNVEPLAPHEKSASGARYRGSIGDDQLAFVAGVLANTPCDSLIVLSMHIPLASFEDPDSPSDMTVDRSRLLALLSQHPHNVSFSGHSHTTEHHYLGADHGFSRATPHHHHVLTAACGSWWSGPVDDFGVPLAVSRDGSPKGFHVLAVDGNQYETRFQPFDENHDPVARIFSSLPEGEVLVDVFDGGPRTRVTCEAEGWPEHRIALARASLTDPFVVDIFSRYADLLKPWVTAAPSSHIWSGALPDDLAAAGAVIVRISDEYGRSHSRRIVPGASANEKGHPFGQPLISSVQSSL